MSDPSQINTALDRPFIERGRCLVFWIDTDPAIWTRIAYRRSFLDAKFRDPPAEVKALKGETDVER